MNHSQSGCSLHFKKIKIIYKKVSDLNVRLKLKSKECVVEIIFRDTKCKES